MVNFLTNIAAWFLKNVNLIVGVVSALVKAIVGVINLVQPSKDELVDKVEEIGQKIQGYLFTLSEALKSMGL